MPAPSPDRPNVVLTGFMGTGKTTVGRLLAEALGYELIDTDAVIEARHGPITGIFATRGEDAFRALEREVALELADRSGLVVSTGGRMMLDEANIEALGRHGRVFCLTASPEAILARVLADPSRVERPLLAVADPETRIRELLAERAEGYARFTQISTDHRNPDEVAAHIERTLT